MKKTLAILLTLVLVFAMGTMAVSAATSASPEVNGIISGTEIKDADSKDVSVEFVKIDGKVATEFQNELKDLKKESGDNNIKVVAQYEVKTEGTPKYPLTVTLDVLGVSASSKVYVMVKEGDSVKTIETTVVNGKITFTVENAIQKIAIVTDKATATNVEKENNVLSPQTGDASVMVAVMGVLAFVAAGFVFKKVKA
jgi:LPXTG-motif cell wall-anchored protein